jgi:hypothetical protein
VREAPWGRVLECIPLAEVAAHAFTTRDVDFKPGGHENLQAWRGLAQHLGARPDRVSWPRQVHGASVAAFRRDDGPGGGDGRPEADIVISDDPGRVIAVQIADCVAMLLADRRTGAVGAAHAGWRGSAQGVARVAVAAMRAHFGTDPHDVVVAMGPSIGACCYEVGEEVRRAFEQADGHGTAVASWFSGSDAGRARLDLWRANRDQLVSVGVPPAQIHVAALCTSTRRELFFSYRAEGARAGRMAAAIRAGTVRWGQGRSR